MKHRYRVEQPNLATRRARRPVRVAAEVSRQGLRLEATCEIAPGRAVRAGLEVPGALEGARDPGTMAASARAAFEKLGLRAEVFYAQSPEWIQQQLAGGRPVMVWTTSGMTIHPVATWTADDGVTVKGVPGEHTYLAVGYDADGVWLIDPYDGRRHHFAWETFLASWDLLDRMAVVVTEEEPAPVPTSMSTTAGS